MPRGDSETFPKVVWAPIAPERPEFKGKQLFVPFSAILDKKEERYLCNPRHTQSQTRAARDLVPFKESCSNTAALLNAMQRGQGGSTLQLPA